MCKPGTVRGLKEDSASDSWDERKNWLTNSDKRRPRPPRRGERIHFIGFESDIFVLKVSV